MDAKNLGFTVKPIVSRILAEKTIDKSIYDEVVYILQNRVPGIDNVIYVLRYLDLNSDYLDLLIKNYEQEKLSNFLNPNNPNLYQDFPIKEAFTEKDKHLFPPEGTCGPITERFRFFDKTTEQNYEIIRNYLIDCNGVVQEFLHEDIIEVLDDPMGFSGILGEEFFSSNLNEGENNG